MAGWVGRLWVVGCGGGGGCSGCGGGLLCVCVCVWDPEANIKGIFTGNSCNRLNISYLNWIWSTCGQCVERPFFLCTECVCRQRNNYENKRNLSFVYGWYNFLLKCTRNPMPKPQYFVPLFSLISFTAIYTMLFPLSNSGFYFPLHSYLGLIENKVTTLVDDIVECIFAENISDILIQM